MASDGATGDAFGASISLSGDTVVIGALQDGLDAGRPTCSCERAIWTEEAKLEASDGAAGDHLRLLGLHLGRRGAGRRENEANGRFFSGAAYLFLRSGAIWTEEAKLTGSDTVAGDRFGYSVALDGWTALVGALRHDAAGTDSGSAYVFCRSPPSVSAPRASPPLAARRCARCWACRARARPRDSPSFASGVQGQKDGLFFFGTNGQQANPWGNGTSYQCVVPPVVPTRS